RTPNIQSQGAREKPAGATAKIYCQDRGIDDPEQPLTPTETSNIQHRTPNIQSQGAREKPAGATVKI
ncbi:MAG: hypothetical protein WCK27_31785, partial [Verrucomicrobiota bacterium]